MFRRSIRHTVRSPDTMLMTVALPVLILLMFVYVFGGAIQIGEDYLNYVVPGIILLCAGFGASLLAPAICADVADGIVDRFRTTAVAPTSVLAGHVMASVLRNLVMTAIVLALAVALGFRPNADLPEWAAATAVVAMYVLTISWIAVALGLLVRNPEAAGGVTFPFMFLPYVSSAFVPPNTMPAGLRWIAQHQPITPVIETMRGLLTGTPIGASALLTVAWCAGLGAAGYACAATLFRRAANR